MASKSLVVGLTAVGLMGLGAAGTVHAGGTIAESVLEGKGSIDFRLRYENVDQDGADEKADALTLRTRLEYKTGDYKGAYAFVQMDDVTAIGDEDYNSTVNGNTEFPVVADPTGTEVNQAYLAYKLNNTTFKYGRQEVVLDNARFVGNVGWRQNAQSYDAFTVVAKPMEGFGVVYGYVTNVNRIFGESSANSDIDTKTHLLNLSYSGFDFAKISAYGYFLELDDAPQASSKTIGVRLNGGMPLSDSMKLLYTAELADQSSYKDGDDSIDAGYQHLMLGLKAGGITAKIGYEVLEGDGDFGFSTPLATLHAFNGWTDKFLGTPADGLIDTYISIGGKVAGVKLMAVYHDFEADNGGESYGSETGFLVAKKISKNYKLVGKYASYSADDHSVDTDKLWLMAQATFK